MSDLKQRVESFLQLESSVTDAEEMLELGDEDEDIARELQETIEKAAKKIDQLELERMLGGEYDANGAILSINAGAGGTESQETATSCFTSEPG